MSRTRSREEKSAIVRGGGLLASFAIDLMKAVEEAGGDDTDIHRLVTEEGRPLLRDIAEVVTRGYSVPRGAVVHVARGIQTYCKTPWADLVNQGAYASRLRSPERELSFREDGPDGIFDAFLIHFAGGDKKEGYPFQRARNWRKENNLVPASPREVLYLCGQRPELDVQIGAEYPAITSPMIYEYLGNECLVAVKWAGQPFLKLYQGTVNTDREYSRWYMFRTAIHRSPGP